MCWFSVKKMVKGCVTWFIYFLRLLSVRYNITVPSFFILGYVRQILERGAFLHPHPHPHPWTALKRSILNRVKVCSKELLKVNWDNININSLQSETKMKKKYAIFYKKWSNFNFSQKEKRSHQSHSFPSFLWHDLINPKWFLHLWVLIQKFDAAMSQWNI